MTTEGTITLEGSKESVLLPELNEKIKDYMDTSQLKEVVTINDINRCMEDLKLYIDEKLTENKAPSFLEGLFQSIISNILFYLLIIAISQGIQLANTPINNKMIKDVKGIYQSAHVGSSNLRVAIRFLDVRNNPNLNSPIIGKISFGCPVEVIHKNRNWCRVRFYEGEVMIEGWVLTRYIKKFYR